MKPDKPSYRTSRLQLWWTFFFAWAVIFLIVIKAVTGSSQAVDLAPTIVPAMIFLIAAMLGIHRGFGSLDYRAAREAAPETPSPSSFAFNPRDSPDGTGEHP